MYFCVQDCVRRVIGLWRKKYAVQVRLEMMDGWMDLGLVLMEKSEMVGEAWEKKENWHHGFSFQGLSAWSLDGLTVSVRGPSAGCTGSGLSGPASVPDMKVWRSGSGTSGWRGRVKCSVTVRYVYVTSNA